MNQTEPDGYSFNFYDDGIGLFQIERPPRLNALTRPVLDGISQALTHLRQQQAHALIFIGAGEKAFCAGTDLHELQGMSQQQRMEKNHRARQLMLEISQAPFVTLAALNGLAYGGGLELAMACDLRLAAAHAKVALPEIKLGLIPAYGGTQFLPALVGKSVAAELMLTGRSLDAPEALTVGLISRIANTQSAFADQARAYALQITQHSRPAREAIMACIEVAGGGVSQAGLDFEDQKMREVFKTEDAAEGVLAFREKRAANFKHR